MKGVATMGRDRVRSEFPEERVGNGRVLWDPHVSLVGKQCGQALGTPGRDVAGFLCLSSFPFRHSCAWISISVCPHLYLNSYPCHSLSLSCLYPVEGSLGLRACGDCGQAQSKLGMGWLRNSLEGRDPKEGVSGVFEFEPRP